MLLFVGFVNGKAQENKEQKEQQKESKEYLYAALEELKNDDFPEAERDYRKAIALNPKDETGKYNLGNAYYGKDLNSEAMRRFQQAASIAVDKTERHKSFHNLGNTYMNSKQYKEAVEAYKNALRNNPSDNETRYNLALAKKMLEDQQQKGGGENEDNNEQEDNQEKQNKEDKNEDQQGDQGDEKENEDQGDKKDENKDGDKKEDNGNPEEQKKNEDNRDKQQAVPGQLSPQQIKNLLEAMNNEEKKVQEKINAKKQKGAKVKSNKDW